jgi:hypothetical protein
MVQVDPSAKFSDLRPVRSRPPLYHFCGFGLYLYGDRDFDMETQSFVRTLCFCLLCIPVVALRSYRVTPTDEGWRYLGRVPVSGAARLLSLGSAVVLLGFGGTIGVTAYLKSPSQVASRQLAEADRLAALGRMGDAVVLFADVAVGPSEHAVPTAKRLATLLVSASSQENPEGLGEVFRAAVRVQKAGRWPGTPQALSKRGVDLARHTAVKDPRGAWTILDSIAHLIPEEQSTAELRHDLLEKIVAAEPSDPEWASRLAIDYESKGQLDRCEKILEPLRAKLGESEGARVLGLIDARNDRIDKALPMLRAYTKNRLKQLGNAEAKLRSLFQSAQERILGQLKNQRVSDFNYDRYQNANENGRERILIEYIEAKLKGNPEITQAQQALVAQADVTPAALELGIILLQHAQAQTDAQARKSLLDEAEATFLAVSRIAGDREDYQLSLAQVYYWQGKHNEGRSLLDDVLKAHNRDPNLLLQVARLLRSVGSNSEARVLAEEGYGKASPGQIKSGFAVLRGLLGDDVEDRILWLQRGDANEPQIKAILYQDLAHQALRDGNEDRAVANLKSVVSMYESMPESAATLNNEWIALNQLASLTGDARARQRAAAMIEKAAAIDPGNSLTLSNAAQSLLEEGLIDVIGLSIDLSALRQRPSLEMLDFLADDEQSREAIVARVRTQRAVNRALSIMDKVVLLAPRNPSSYQAPSQVLAFRRDAEGLRKLLSALSRTELDLGDQAKNTLENYSGKKDDTMKSQALSALKYVESNLPVARAKGGPTFAVAVSHVIGARVAAATYGIAADPNAMVALTEEAFASSHSLASRWNMIDALLLRGTDRMASSNQKFAALRDRSRRAVSPTQLIGVTLSLDGPLKELALKDPDINRALDLLHESYAACPRYTSGPHSWALFRSKYPDAAAAVAKLYLMKDTDMLEDEIRARLRPYDSTVSLKAYWRARIENKENEALEIVKDAKAKGIPLPIDAP